MMNLVLAFSILFAVAPAAKPTAPVTPRPTGGMVRLNGEGKISLVNTCNAPAKSLNSAARGIGDLLMLRVECPKGSWSLATAANDRKSIGANVAVFVVSDPALPMSLIALEAKWGMVNAAGLDESGLTKEIVRVATVVLGGVASSKYTASAMRPVSCPADLAKAGDLITIDSLMAICPNLESLGLRQFDMMTYREACEAGVAPAPVNDEQRKIAAEFKSGK